MTEKEENVAADTTPAYDSVEWSDYVLSLLDKTEKDKDGNPLTDGLRRVAIKLFGAFQILPPTVHAINEGYAAVTVNLVFPADAKYSGSAEVSSNNCDDPYAKYPLATAETRALGRALRNVLNLRKVITAEESARKALISSPFPEDQPTDVSEIQLKTIGMICKSHNMSVKNVVHHLVGELNSIKDLTHQQAQSIISDLHEWVRTDKVPKDKVGIFDPDWKTTF